jgi:hypothetical protein
MTHECWEMNVSTLPVRAVLSITHHCIIHTVPRKISKISLLVYMSFKRGYVEINFILSFPCKRAGDPTYDTHRTIPVIVHHLPSCRVNEWDMHCISSMN